MQLSEQDLIRIFEATRAITSTLGLSDLLKTVMRLASEVVRAEASSLLLLDPVTDELYFDLTLGEKGGALQQIRLKKGEGIAGWVAEHRQAAVVNDVTQDPRWTQKADKTTQFQTKSILAVPMQVYDKLVGVMEVINRADGQPFSEADARILEAFASQAAVAIENARLFESIRQEKEKMSTMLGEMIEGVILLDPAGRVVLSNLAARKLLGSSQLDGTTWKSIEETFQVQPAWEEIASTLGGAGGVELSRLAAPSLFLAGVINQICDDRGKVTGYLLVLSNVTEERREAQMKKNFLALVSHKLKTPLVAIRGFTPMLLEKPEELTSFQRTAIETIDRNSQTLTSLVEKLVWFAALESETLELTRKPYSIADVLDVALTDLAPLLRTVETQIIKEPSLLTLPMVVLDKIWMKEVFRNLIENAIKFNPNQPRQLCIRGQFLDGTVRLSFIDNGPGIPSEKQEQIFQKFYQIDDHFTGQVQGMGLGLALVKRVVEEHGGQIRVESTLGEGSVFVVTLPAVS
ncbi:MAG: ATP-binding protein [Elusimicrobiota bacterium]|jgi:signal transduction histidine kinase